MTGFVGDKSKKKKIIEKLKETYTGEDKETHCRG